MLRTLIQFVFPCTAALMLPGCSPSAAPDQAPIPAIAFDDPPNAASKAASGETTDLSADEMLGPRELVYATCEEAEATTVLVVRVTVPHVIRDHPFRIPLCRRHIRKSEFQQGICLQSLHVEAKSPKGFRYGYSICGSVTGATDTTVNVSVSVHWTPPDRDHSRGSFDVELPITVPEESQKQLDGNISVRWEFLDPKASSRTINQTQHKIVAADVLPA